MKSRYFTKIGEEATKSKWTAEDEEEYQNEPLVVELYINQALKRRGLNQKQLAEMTGIRPAAISQLCRGFVDRLNLDHIGRIGTALRVESIEEIVRLVKVSEADATTMKPRGHRDED